MCQPRFPLRSDLDANVLTDIKCYTHAIRSAGISRAPIADLVAAFNLC